MELTKEQYEMIREYLPVQRGNVSMDNLNVLNAILYVAEHGCKWRGLPKRFGNWHTLYTRMNRWSKSGVLARVFEQLQKHQMIRVRVETVGLDSTIIKVHPDGTGALKKTARKPLAKALGGWTTKLHLVAADSRHAFTLSVSPGNAADGVEGRKLLEGWKDIPQGALMVMDRAYEGDQTRQLVFDLGMIPVVPPKINRLNPGEYDREVYKKRNEVERLFRRLKGFRRIFSRFEKLDSLFIGFIHFVLIMESLRLC